MIDGGSTAEEAAKLLREAGAKRVWLAVTHGVCSPGVLTRLRRANFERIFIGDTLPLPKGLLKRRGTTVVPMLDAFRGLR
jgi:ribose-phosphate pyrophosphokinase